MPLYQLYELTHAALNPARAYCDYTRMAFRNPINPLAHTPFGRSVAAGAEIFERVTRRYVKPSFDITEVNIDGQAVPVREEVIWTQPFCRLLHFKREFAGSGENGDSKLLLVAPMSGHYSTLLRGTVRAMLQRHDVYIIDWTDARMVPITFGAFDLDDYIDYLIAIFQLLEGDVHVMAVCQPSVPLLAAVALMEADGDPRVPQTMTLMGGPIDTRANPTAVNDLAKSHSVDWFRRNVIMNVPWPHLGVTREVYPGFLQLTGFMTMNLDRHVSAHGNLFENLVHGDGETAEKHRNFYDEYLAVMDLDAAFYLQTVETVFIRHALPKGEMLHRGRRVDPAKIKRVPLMTIEGENDDISGVGQTQAAHELCTGLPEGKKHHHLQPNVGHYGIFNGKRFEAEVAPRISSFIAANHKAR
jgi:poly(3-hydroxybutyrate) depolymerase